MPLKQLPTFRSTGDKMFEVPQPGIGGLNLKDLEYEQETNQSPFMLNMMYHNGTFSKRYGQEIYETFNDEIYAMTYFAGQIITHSGTKVYKGIGTSRTEIKYGDGTTITLPEEKGVFMRYAQSLYYLVGQVFYEYKYDNDPTHTTTYQTYVWKQVEYYIPEAFYSAKPDGSSSENGDNFNALSNKFIVAYNGDGSSTVYKAYGDSENLIDWELDSTTQKHKFKVVWVVDGEDVEKTEGTDYTVDSANKKITFTSAPASGGDNVEITFAIKEDAYKVERDMILHAKYWSTFGNADNSRLFLAGFGDYGRSCYYYSEAYDASYFPIYNYEYIGNSEEDITGFGLQYNVLFIFKAKEIYSIAIYTQTYATTSEENLVGTEAFKTQLVNPAIGCDAPYTIQLIDNRLTWYNSNHGICTLVSTNIIDERNVRPIGRNIESTNNFDIVGILDIVEDLEKVVSVDYDHKYFLVFPTSGKCFMWDYEISPYYYTSNKETDAKQLDFYLFNNFFVKEFVVVGKELIYSSRAERFNKNVIKLNRGFRDLDFNNDGEDDAIESYYMTPFYQFSAVEYLKNVKNIYVQCRGDTASVIDMYYYTDSSIEPEQDPESIRIGGRIWNHFDWSNFQWMSVNWANTFMRKCSLKKIQMASFLFKNNELDRDMSISHIGLTYQIVKLVK